MRRFLTVASTRLSVVAGLLALGVLTAMPASAQAACQNSTGVLVEFLGVGTSNTIIMEQVGGSFQGDVRVRVYCGLDGALIPNATVSLTTTVPNSQVLQGSTWQAATSPSAVVISLPTGESTITLRSSDPNLTGWKARVGTNTVTVTGAYGMVISPTDYPTATGAIWAQTPELSSVALFGSGALGMAGYALTRMRAARRPRSS